MKKYAVLRVCADICFYYFILSFITVLNLKADGRLLNFFELWRLPISAFVLACFALGFLIVRCDTAALRLAISLLPGLCFMLGRFELQMLFPMVAWIYYVIVMTIGNFDTPLDLYRRRIKVSMFISVLIALLFIGQHNVQMSTGGSALVAGELYGLLFFVLSVLAMRGMSRGASAPPEMRLFDLASVVVTPTLLVGLAMLVIALLRAASPLFGRLFSPIASFFVWLFLKIFPQDGPPEVEAQRIGYDQAPNLLNPYKDLLEEQLEQKVVEKDQVFNLMQNDTPTYIGVVIVLALVVALCIYLAVKNSGEKAVKVSGPEQYDFANEVTTERRVRKKRRADVSNVKQIRALYRSYLEIVDLRHSVGCADTSQDVLGYSKTYFDMPETDELRELYIAARYGDPKAITQKQVSEAKRCISAIENENRSMADQNVGPAESEFETATAYDSGKGNERDPWHRSATNESMGLTGRGNGGLVFRKK